MIKKIFIILVLNLVFLPTARALIVSQNDVEPGTYIVGKYMFTRTPNEENNYDGKLNTQKIMLASRTITDANESNMIIYYKNIADNWINGLTGQKVVVPSTFEIEVVDMNIELLSQTNNVDLSDYIVNKDDVYPSTYIIGNYMYTRDVDKKHNYNGILNTQKIMLASETLTGSKESDMVIYFKTASGNWINALTGETVNPPAKFEISTINLRNQLEKMDIAILDRSFNSKAKALAGTTAEYLIYAKNTSINSIKEAKSLPDIPLSDDNLVSHSDSDIPIYIWYQNGEIYYFAKKYYSKDIKIYLSENSSYMFYNFSSLTNLDLSNFDTSNVINMYNMFAYCESLTELDLSTFDTSKVTNMSGMFYKDKALTNLNLSSFDTSQVTNMSYMFYENKALTNLNLSNFDTSNVSDMGFMFTALSLTSLNVSNFNTSNVTDIQFMFASCGSLKKLDLSNFDLSKVTQYSYALYGINGLEEIVTPKVNGEYEIALPKTMYDLEDNAYSSLTISTPTETVLRIPNMISKGIEFNAKIKNMAGSVDANNQTVNENITAIKKSSSLPNTDLDKENILSMPGSDDALYIWYDNGVIYYHTSASEIYLPQEATYMFANLPNLKTLDLSIFDSSQVMYMSYMFYNCSSLTSIDMSNFDLSNVKSATTIFYGTTALVALNTPKVNANIDIILSKPLYDSEGKSYTKITNELTSSILLESKTQLISGQLFNEKIKKLAGNSVATYSNINRTITEIKRSATLPNDVTENNIVSTSDSSRLIYVWYDEGIIYYYTEASRIYLNNNASYMFNNLRELTNVDLDIINTGNVTNMGYMFDSCEKLTNLDLSNFDMSNVNINMNMLNGLTNLSKLTTPKKIVGEDVSLPHTMYDSNGTSYAKLTSSTLPEIVLKIEW